METAPELVNFTIAAVVRGVGGRALTVTDPHGRQVTVHSWSQSDSELDLFAGACPTWEEDGETFHDEQLLGRTVRTALLFREERLALLFSDGSEATLVAYGDFGEDASLTVHTGPAE